MRLILFTTTDSSAKRDADFVRMVESVRAGTRRGVPTKLFVLFQRASARDALKYERLLPEGTVAVTCAERLSLSDARNRLLKIAQAHLNVGDDGIVGFPDDDCWYPTTFLRQLSAAFSRDPELDMLACRVSLDPTEPLWAVPHLTLATAKKVVRRSSSNSIFFRSALVKQLGTFDPALGLGTPNGSGEDTDYALRAFLRARKAVFVDLALVGHRESDLDSVVRYFKGSMIVLSRYALESPQLFLEFIRKIAVGVYLTGRSRMAVRDYLATIRLGVAELYRTALDAQGQSAFAAARPPSSAATPASK